MTSAAHLAARYTEAPGENPLETDADERRRSFLRMVSHELRTPLNSIIGFSEILTSELHGALGAPQYREYAEIIRGSGYKLLKLVNQVLEIARLEGGTMDFDLQVEPMDAAIEDVLVTLREEMTTRDVAVRLVDHDAMPSVIADSRGLRTVLGHLLHNAIAYSPEGGEVRIATQVRGKVVDILIENEGESIVAEDLPRLLLPFEQGENALTRRSEGAGLGLPISQLTCQAMGGRLQLTSGLARGVIARVRLPKA